MAQTHAEAAFIKSKWVSTALLQRTLSHCAQPCVWRTDLSCRRMCQKSCWHPGKLMGELLGIGDERSLLSVYQTSHLITSSHPAPTILQGIAALRLACLYLSG